MPESPPQSFAPSFDDIFQHQSSEQPSSSTSSSMSFPFSKPFTHGQSYVDEPPQMDGRAGASSPFQHGHERQRTTSSGRQQNLESRQNSIPWSSTIITTAGKQDGQDQADQADQQQAPRHESQMRFPPPDQRWPIGNGYEQFTMPNPADQAQTPSSFSFETYNTPGSGGYASTPMSISATPSGMGGFDYGQGGGFDQGADLTRVKNEFMDDGLFNGDAYPGGLGGSAEGNGNGHSRQGSGSGDGNVKMEEFMEDLLQSLSRSASREPSPGFQTDQYFLQQQQNALQSLSADQGMQSHLSSHGSRPVSPFGSPANAPSPSFASASIPRPGSSPSGQSFLINKPQSPPVLQMPNNAPSPVSLPPIVTQQSGQPGGGTQGQGHSLANQMGGMGGLLPPTNPALQHLSGMMGISPIAPSADGPQIFVQPSTPISGLKDGRGHFDAALRRAAQQAEQNRRKQNGGDSQSQQFTVPSPNMGSNVPSPQPQHQTSQYQQNAMDFATRMAMQASSGWGDLGSQFTQTRPRAKSDSFAPSPGGMARPDFEQQAMAQIMAQAQAMGLAMPSGQVQEQAPLEMSNGGGDWRDNVGAWLNSMGMGGVAPTSFGSGYGGAGGSPAPPGTVNPNQLPGNDQEQLIRQMEQRHQLEQLQLQAAQKSKMGALSVNTQTTSSSGILRYEPGEFSPTSMAFYQQRGMWPPSQFGLGTNSAPYYNTTFQQGQGQFQPPSTAPLHAGQGYGYLDPGQGSSHARRQSFGEGMSHHATGAGTPGYGMGFAGRGQDPGLTGRVRGVSPSGGHRRAAKSEDFGRGGWGIGHGGSTTEFLNSITANDGSLIPPLRGGHTHSRHSSVSSGRSASPALSVSSHGSSFSHASGSGHGHMDMPDGSGFGDDLGESPGSSSGAARGGQGGRARLSKMKVTSVATEVAATNRRTNNGIFQCPVPGCGSTFTRHFNLKGHMRSHNDERPYKCLYDGCPKGFARQHDCKRHMLLHEGLRPFECDACHKKFARLDALTRHHKSEQGIECAIACPLPVNPDGSAMSESQYKHFKAAQGLLAPATAGGKKGRKRAGSRGSSAGGRSGDEEGGGGGSGMDDYDRA